MPDSEGSVIAGSVIGTFAFIGFVLLTYKYAGPLLQRLLGFKYDVVDHGLDSEEIEFKKIIEMQSDDIEELFDIPDEELDFDVKDKDRLSMIETYRRNLVAAANDSNNDAIDEDALRL